MTQGLVLHCIVTHVQIICMHFWSQRKPLHRNYKPALSVHAQARCMIILHNIIPPPLPPSPHSPPLLFLYYTACSTDVAGDMSSSSFLSFKEDHPQRPQTREYSP